MRKRASANRVSDRVAKAKERLKEAKANADTENKGLLSGASLLGGLLGAGLGHSMMTAAENRPRSTATHEFRVTLIDANAAMPNFLLPGPANGDWVPESVHACGNRLAIFWSKEKPKPDLGFNNPPPFGEP